MAQAEHNTKPTFDPSKGLVRKINDQAGGIGISLVTSIAVAKSGTALFLVSPPHTGKTYMDIYPCHEIMTKAGYFSLARKRYTAAFFKDAILQATIQKTKQVIIHIPEWSAVAESEHMISNFAIHLLGLSYDKSIGDAMQQSYMIKLPPDGFCSIIAGIQPKWFIEMFTWGGRKQWDTNFREKIARFFMLPEMPMHRRVQKEIFPAQLAQTLNIKFHKVDDAEFRRVANTDGFKQLTLALQYQLGTDRGIEYAEKLTQAFLSFMSEQEVTWLIPHVARRFAFEREFMKIEENDATIRWRELAALIYSMRRINGVTRAELVKDLGRSEDTIDRVLQFAKESKWVQVNYEKRSRQAEIVINPTPEMLAQFRIWDVPTKLKTQAATRKVVVPIDTVVAEPEDADAIREFIHAMEERQAAKRQKRGKPE
jgi:hypothetical protein